MRFAETPRGGVYGSRRNSVVPGRLDDREPWAFVTFDSSRVRPVPLAWRSVTAISASEHQHQKRHTSKPNVNTPHLLSAVTERDSRRRRDKTSALGKLDERAVSAIYLALAFLLVLHNP